MRDKFTVIKCRISIASWATTLFFRLLGVLLACIPQILNHIPSSVNSGCSNSAAGYGQSANSDLAAVWLFGTLGSSIILTALWRFVHCFRARIKASENGLHWRGIWKWKEARWDEITDTYRGMYTIIDGDYEYYYVNSPAGKLRFFGNQYTNSDELREYISLVPASSVINSLT